MPRKRKRALVVDDEELLRELVAEMLDALGWDSETCADGREALARYSEDPDAYDIVLLDMVMPRMGGRETFRRLLEINPDVRVLIVSGYSLSQDAREVLESGARGYLPKPFRMEELLESMGRALA